MSTRTAQPLHHGPDGQPYQTGYDPLDDDAPITSADIAAARKTMRRARILTFALVAVVVLAVPIDLFRTAWQEAEQERALTACMLQMAQLDRADLRPGVGGVRAIHRGVILAPLPSQEAQAVQAPQPQPGRAGVVVELDGGFLILDDDGTTVAQSVCAPDGRPTRR
jgi:hypothetical protein